ncbi:MAG: hypothetical protein QGD92_04505 [Gammaproteobacteria bacterium]|nr:hypothetical protein [Gammaproteobacteria bacterium]
MQTDTELSALQRSKQLVSHIFGPRPIWMNALMVFCAYMTFIYLPWDLFVKPVAEDQEVWFGILLTGWAAKATEPLHWAIYAAGTWGFWKMRSWMWPWASLYVLQIAFSMFVWQFLHMRGNGILGGLAITAPFLLLSVALWRTRWRFDPETEASPEQGETSENSAKD